MSMLYCYQCWIVFPSLIAIFAIPSVTRRSAMAETRVKVLNMLADGTLTVEQANQLLAALGADADAGTASSEEQRAGRQERRERGAEQRFGDFTFDQVL